MESHKFSAGTVSRVGNVMKIVYDKDSEVTLDDMKEITAIRENLFGEENYCSLIDLRKEFLSLSPEAKKFAAENPNVLKFRVAEVLLVKNFAQKLGVQTYVKLFRKDPVRVFSDEAKAMKWLETEFNYNISKKGFGAN